MTIDQVRDILRQARDDKAGEHRHATSLVCYGLLTQASDYDHQYGEDDNPNEVVASWLTAFEEVCADLRRKLVDRDEVGRLAALAEANGHDRYSVGNCLGTFADDRMIEDIILDTIAGGDSAEWVEECLTDAKYA